MCMLWLGVFDMCVFDNEGEDHHPDLFDKKSIDFATVQWLSVFVFIYLFTLLGGLQ